MKPSPQLGSKPSSVLGLTSICGESDEQILKSLENLHAYLSQAPLSSYDPYDYKGSNAAALLMSTTGGARLLHTLGAIAPIVIRRVLGIEPSVTASGVAYAASGYFRLAQAAQSETLRARAEQYIAVLNDLRIGQGGWGLPFAWQSQKGLRIPTDATLSYTTYTGLAALYDSFELFGNEEHLARAAEIATCSIKELNWITHGRNGLVSYSRFDRLEVINTNALLGAILLKIGHAAQDRSLLKLGVSMIGFVVAEQNADGSWPYYSHRTHSAPAIDNYHTAMTIRGLIESAPFLAVRPEKAIADGVRYYCGAFLDKHSFAALWPQKVWPKDIACPAEGILMFNSLSLLGRRVQEPLQDPNEISPAEKARELARWAARNMQNSDGSFLQRKYPFWETNTKSLRWGQGMMLLALSTFPWER